MASSGSVLFKFLKPSMRPQSTDFQAAGAWGVAALATGIWIVQPFDWLKKTFFEKPSEENEEKSGNEKDHLKVTLLRVDSSLQGVSSWLPDFIPSSRNGKFENPGRASFLIAGATGSTVGSTRLREKTVDVIHVACKHLLEEKSDDSILLLLVIRIIFLL